MLQLDAPRKVLGMEQDLNVGGLRFYNRTFFGDADVRERNSTSGKLRKLGRFD
jgi:hypothetical protein